MAATDTAKLMGVGFADGQAKQLDASYGVSTGTLAATGTTIADAALITTEFVRVTAVDGTKGVKLPALANVPIGKLITIVNTDTGVNALKVYSNAAGELITGQAGSTAISVASKLMLRCVKYDATNWYCEKGVTPY